MPDADSDSSSTSLSLIQRARRFDPQAWERLCDVYGPLVYRWARSRGLREEDAKDIGQEVFRTVAGRIESFRKVGPDDTFRGWLWTITRHKLGDFIRRAVESPQSVGGEASERLAELPEFLEEESKSSSEVSRGILHRTLQAIRAEFEEKTWQAFWRATVDEDSTGDIAQDLGMTRQAVRQAKYRVLRRLRTELNDDSI